MGPLTASLEVMRWELLSAVMMFVASTFHVKCRQTSHNALAMVFTGIGIGMSCWFVTGLLGITINTVGLFHFLSTTKDSFVEVMSRTPADWPMP